MTATGFADDILGKYGHRTRVSFEVNSSNPAFLVELEMVNRTGKPISGWAESSPIGLVKVTLVEMTDDKNSTKIDEHLLRPIIPIQGNSRLNEFPAKDVGEDTLFAGQAVSVGISIALEEEKTILLPDAKTPNFVRQDGIYKVFFTLVKTSTVINEVKFEVATSASGTRIVSLLKE